MRAELARRSLLDFIEYTYPDYHFAWFHKLLISKLERFAAGEIRRLMVFMPPQHGKSELVSRRLPAYILGKQPDRKIVGCSYSSDLSSSFNRDIQRIVDSDEYHDIFPETTLASGNVRSKEKGTYLRNNDIFEVVGNKGFYKSVGVGGSLTGTPCDLGIIDDPVKDAMEAYSERVRNTIWEWYTNVFKTRLHNDSQVLLTMTRWHEDDLAGRILRQAEQNWEVLVLPAIKENNDNPDDKRQIGEALWPEKHSLEKIMEGKRENPRMFASLQQQRPAPEEGGIFKKQYFENYIEPHDWKTIYDQVAPIVETFADTAYTEKKQNDPTAMLACAEMNGNLYIINVEEVWMEFPELVKYSPQFHLNAGADHRSRFYIEPKASGLSLAQQLRQQTEMNVSLLPAPKDDKVARANSVTARMESGKVILVRGPWNEKFINQCLSFPNAVHDDMVDVLVHAVAKKLNAKRIIVY